MTKIDELARNRLNQRGEGGIGSESNPGDRIVFPAIVVPNGNNDPSGQNRIRARIVAVNEEGRIIGKKSDNEENYNNYAGKDKGRSDDELPLAMPLMPDFLYLRPLVGEMVYIILENPKDDSSARFWIGPIINSSEGKLKFQAYEDALRVFDYTDFFPNKRTTDKLKASGILPEPSDVALQGRDDSDLILRPREVFLTAGKFNPNSSTLNTKSPANLQIKQFEKFEGKGLTTSNEGLLEQYSQANLISTNINFHSSRGKYRGEDSAKFEKNEDLKSFGELANALHPAIFGDESIKLFDLIIRVLLNHIHTPQKPLLDLPESLELRKYTVEGNLQNLISNHIRIN